MSETANANPAPGSPLAGTILRDVTWGDCDPAGIIYYPTYFRWIDAGTWNLFFLAGLTLASLRKEFPGMDMPAVASSLEFRNPAPFGAKAEVRSRVEHWGGKSFRVRHEIVRADGAQLASGSETRAWVENTPGVGLRAQAIPDALKQRFFTAR
jgi:YbgC/YbaW family acyl-CoA thioester hydrolase